MYLEVSLVVPGGASGTLGGVSSTLGGVWWYLGGTWEVFGGTWVVPGWYLGVLGPSMLHVVGGCTWPSMPHVHAPLLYHPADFNGQLRVVEFDNGPGELGPSRAPGLGAPP